MENSRFWASAKVTPPGGPPTSHSTGRRDPKETALAGGSQPAKGQPEREYWRIGPLKAGTKGVLLANSRAGFSAVEAR